jgi:formyl-CoA transferase
MMVSPQVAERHFFQGFTQEECGLDRDIRVPMAAFQFKDGGPKLRSPPPRIGQHTEDILQELGYTKEQISDYSDVGII